MRRVVLVVRAEGHLLMVEPMHSRVRQLQGKEITAVVVQPQVLKVAVIAEQVVVVQVA